MAASELAPSAGATRAKYQKFTHVGPLNGRVEHHHFLQSFQRGSGDPELRPLTPYILFICGYGTIDNAIWVALDFDEKLDEASSQLLSRI
jgi:hypothetical protein